MTEATANTIIDPQFAIQRIYIKDLSFETPHAPQIFKQEWHPEISLEINTAANLLEQDIYEVVLIITATVKAQEKVAFLCEVKQAGIFTISGIEGAQLQHTLGSFCPTILFPYAREAITDIVAKGSFPQLILAPVNFEALYAQQLTGKQQQVQHEDSVAH